jgi:hypothetical protein
MVRRGWRVGIKGDWWVEGRIPQQPSADGGVHLFPTASATSILWTYVAPPDADVAYLARSAPALLWAVCTLCTGRRAGIYTHLPGPLLITA